MFLVNVPMQCFLKETTDTLQYKVFFKLILLYLHRSFNMDIDILSHAFRLTGLIPIRKVSHFL